MYKILIVEDDTTIADAVENQLGRWGYETMRVRDFEHVLETFTSFAPSWCCWTSLSPFSTDSTGAHKSAAFPACRLFSCPRQETR